MKFITALLGLTPLVAGHGYVDRAIIGGQNIQFYQVRAIPRHSGVDTLT